jgi:RNA 2',3'-cyclic 3'-phosphodiesterase
VIRAFVAIFPPSEVREALFGAAQNLAASRDFRLVGPEKIHLTLKFLGDVAERDLESVKQALKPIQNRHDPFEVSTSNFGAFPSEKKARILWAGIEEGSEHLRATAENVENLLEPAGFERENRPYVPHLTLGRTRARRTTLDIAATSPPALRFTVPGVDLVESAPGKNRVTYSILASYPFAPGPG